MTDVERIAAATGLLATALAMVGVFVPTVLTPTFSWTGTSLSHMGGVGRPAAPVFNSALVAAGVVGLPFVWRLWIDAANGFERVGTALFGVSVVGMVVVGLNPIAGPGGEGSPGLHMLGALAHFLSYTFGLWVYGSGSVLAGRTRWGLVTIWLGIVHVAAWVVYVVQLAAFGSSPPIEGIALPETVGSVVFAGWLAVTAWGFLSGDPGTESTAAVEG